MGMTTVGVSEARRLQTEEGYTYVDVRSVPEFENGHPEGACSVPLLHLNAATRQMQPNPDFLAVMQAHFPTDAKLLVGCQMGGRSARAAQLLASAGYETAVNVDGGFGGRRDPATGRVMAEGWAGAGLPVETAASTDRGYEALRRQAAEGGGPRKPLQPGEHR